jgi:hypothetical protein
MVTGVARNAGGQAHGRVGGGGVHGTESSPGQGQKEPIAQGQQSFMSGLPVKLHTGTGTGTGTAPEKQYCRTKTWLADAWPRIGHDPAEPSEIAEESLLPIKGLLLRLPAYLTCSLSAPVSPTVN